MPKNKLSFSDLGSLVYSTNPEAMRVEETPIETLPAEKQKLIVLLDKKQRKGKTVTLIQGFEGEEEALNDLAKTLKTKCGIGGSAKDGEIILQGECKDKDISILQQLGYIKTKAK